MSTPEDFDAPRYRAKATVSFRVGGREWHCKGNIPYVVLAARPELGGNGELNVGAFFGQVLVEDEVDDFLKMVNGPRGPLHSGNLEPLVRYIVEQVTGRPTERPKSSGRGSRYTAPKSRAASSSAGGQKTASAL